MPKRPSRPGFPAITLNDDTDSGRHRACGVARAAIARTEQLAQRLDDHAEDDSDRLGDLSRDVDGVREEVKTVNNHVGNLRVDVAKMAGVVNSINDSLAEQNEIKHVRAIVEVETGKAEKIAAIEDEVDRNKARRAFWLKTIMVIVGLAGTTVGVMIEHFR